MTSAVPTVNLGIGFSGLSVSAIGFGAMALTPIYGAVDDTKSLATLNHCLDVGVTFIDTANIYGGGENERLIANLLQDRRDEVTLATKFGIAGNPAAGQRTVRGDAAYVRQCIEQSLGRGEHRRRRSVLPAPTGSKCADRGDGRRDGGAGDRR